MSEPAEIEAPAPAPKAKRKPRRKRAKRLPNAVQKPDELAGLNRVDCASACKVGRCVITETRFCGHPFKSSHANPDRKVVERIEAAKRLIAHQAIEKAVGQDPS